MNREILEFRGGRVEITPERPLPLAGFSRRKNSYEGIRDPIEANAIILTSSNNRLVIIGLDLLYVGQIRSRLLEYLVHRVPAAEIFTAASHTHFAPATDPSLPALGTFSESFVDFTAQRIAKFIDELLKQRPVRCAIRYRAVNTDYGMNRRRTGWKLTNRGVPFLERTIRNLPNPEGSTDRQVRIMSIENIQHDNQLLGCIWNASCHPVSQPAWNYVSADFPGAVREKVRERFTSIVPVVFLQGFSGNVRPPTPDNLPGIKKAIARSLNGPLFGAFSEASWRMWAERLSQPVVETLSDRAFGHDVTNEIGYTRLEVPLNCLLANSKSEKSISTHAWSVGNALGIFGISAEPMSDHIGMVAKNLGTESVVPVGCIDQVYGYLPTKGILDEGGYESCDFLPAFGLHDVYFEDPDEFLLSKIQETRRGLSDSRIRTFLD